MRCTRCGTKLGIFQYVCPSCSDHFTDKQSKPKPSHPIAPNPTETTAATVVNTEHLINERALETDIVGQERAVNRLKAICEYCRKNASIPEHLLIAGHAGTGKRTIARAFASQLARIAKETDAALMERRVEFTAVVTGLERGEVLLMRNIGNLRSSIWPVFSDTLLNQKINLEIGTAPGMRMHPFFLNSFTCIATVERESDCPPELREAFATTVLIEPYSQSELSIITNRIAAKLSVNISPRAAELVASVCGGIPHQIELTLKRLAKLGGGQPITESTAIEILSTFGVNVSKNGAMVAHGDLQGLTGIEFEHFITSLLAKMGFQAQTTKASGDGGIDIFAVLDKPLIGGMYLIQCKKFALNNLVGEPIVREFYGAVCAQRNGAKGIFVTTSGYSYPAIEFARSVGIELVNGQQLKALITEYGASENSTQRNKPLFDTKVPRSTTRLF
jgi:Holliday junction resolvasome RuvABC ATP-dependent DNA helicase subunit